MSPRASWKGNLKVSLVSFPIKLFNAVSGSERISLNQIHKGCNSRLKMPLTCPVHGQVDRSEVVKGYEFEKDKYVIIDPAELEKIKLRSEKTIELTKFVPAESVPEAFLDAPYFMAPDNPIAQEPFRVVREALAKSGLVGLGKVTMSNRERSVVVRPEGKGISLTTLHTAQEVREAAPYFEDITDGKIEPAHLKMATDLITSMEGKFEPAEFKDRYEEALVALISAKVNGQAPVVIQEEELPSTFNFMEALQQSLAGSAPAAKTAPAAKSKGKAETKKPPAKSVEAAPAAKRRRKQA